MASTAAERVLYTIRFDHHYVLIPAFTSADRIVAKTKHPTDAIWKQPPTAPLEDLSAVNRVQEAILG